MQDFLFDRKVLVHIEVKKGAASDFLSPGSDQGTHTTKSEARAAREIRRFGSVVLSFYLVGLGDKEQAVETIKCRHVLCHTTNIRPFRLLHEASQLVLIKSKTGSVRFSG